MAGRVVFHAVNAGSSDAPQPVALSRLVNNKFRVFGLGIGRELPSSKASLDLT